MYGRSYDGRTLTFEASGALRDAALVMRDRETDSWWSIMTADAIGGPLQGTGLRELPVGEKTTWGEWRRRHPQSRVLSVDGVEHDASDPYAGYFTSDRTFGGAEVADDRLPAKEPIYAFRQGDSAFAVPHAAAEGGMTHPTGEGTVYFFHRPAGAPVFAGTEAWEIPSGLAAEKGSMAALAEWVASGKAAGVASCRRLPGFDTYWYTWVAANPATRLLAAGEPSPRPEGRTSP